VFVLRPVPNREVTAISDVQKAVKDIDLFLKEVRTSIWSSHSHNAPFIFLVWGSVQSKERGNNFRSPERKP